MAPKSEKPMEADLATKRVQLHQRQQAFPATNMRAYGDAGDEDTARCEAVILRFGQNGIGLAIDGGIALEDLKRARDFPERNASSSRVFHPQPNHLLNGQHDAVRDVSEKILLILNISNEPASFYTNNRLAAEPSNDFWNIKAVDLRKLPGTQLMIAVITGTVMLGAKWDSRRIWRFLT